MEKNGLILVWDLDQTLIGWSNDQKYTLNTKALSVLKEAFKSKKAGKVSSIIVLTNNSDPSEPINEIQAEIGFDFDFIIARNDPLRNKTNAGVKDIATVNRVLGYDVDPRKVWLMDDMRHKMIDEGAHWIQIAKQDNNPFGSGFFQDPDQTDYFPLLNAIDTKNKKGGKRKRINRRNSLKQKKRRQAISRKRARENK
jgi:hypothetical protein